MISSEKLAQSVVDHKTGEQLSQTVIKKKLRAIIYCRVSTDKQEQDGESLEYQEEKCQQYADLHDYEVLMILKEAKSGFIHYSLREKLTLARQMIRDGMADVLIVFDLRRFSRNFVHSAMIFEEIEQVGGMIVSVSENIDNSLTGKLIRSILAWSAESERHKNVEYSNRHWQTRLAQNLPVATGRAKYGWSWGDKEKTFHVINPEEAPIRYSFLYMFVILDMSLRQIAHKLKEDGILPPERARGVKERARGVKGEAVWHPSTIRNMIMDEANIGILKICWSKKALTAKGTETRIPNPNMKKIENGIPAIADRDLYERALRKLETNQVEKSHRHRNPEDFLLKGHIYCKTCNYKLFGRTNRRKRNHSHVYSYYACTNKRNKYLACPNRPEISATNVNQAVWEDCCRLFERIDLMQKTVEERMEQVISSMLEDTQGKGLILATQQEIAYAEAERDKHSEGSYYYNLISQDINKKKEKLQHYRQEQEESSPVIKQVELYKERICGFLDFLNVMRGRYHEATFQEKRNALDVLGVKVYVYQNKPDHEAMLEVIQKKQQEWFSVPEAAQLTGIASSTLYNCAREGRLQTQLRESRVFIHRDMLISFLKTGIKPKSDAKQRVEITYSPMFAGVQSSVKEMPSATIRAPRSSTRTIKPSGRG